MDSDTRAVLAEVYAHGPGKEVRPGPPPPRVPGRRDGVRLDAVAGWGRLGRAVAGTLRLALAPRRWEPWNPYNDHRAYPSPRAAYLVDVAIRAGGRRWRVDPVRSLLVEADPRAIATGLRTGSAHLELTVHPRRMPAGYGALAEALAWLEAGHVAAALVESGGAHGLAAVSVASAAGVELALAPAGARTWPPERMTAPRSSGLGPRGLSGDPRPLPAPALRALTSAAHRPPAGSPARWPGLRHALAVRDITGLADGWYRVVDGEPVPRRAGPALDQVQAGFRYPPATVAVAGMNAAWVMTAPVAAATAANGGPAYRRFLLAAGAVAQHVGTAAALAGLFCRPARSVDEPTLEAAAAAPAGHDFLYLLLVGRSRVRDYAYDLTHPEVWS